MEFSGNTTCILCFNSVLFLFYTYILSLHFEDIICSPPLPPGGFLLSYIAYRPLHLFSHWSFLAETPRGSRGGLVGVSWGSGGGFRAVSFREEKLRQAEGTGVRGWDLWAPQSSLRVGGSSLPDSVSPAGRALFPAFREFVCLSVWCVFMTLFRGQTSSFQREGEGGRGRGTWL